MKIISKLIITSTLLISGALVSFGADVDPATADAPATTRLSDIRTRLSDMKAKLNDSEYREALGAMTVEQLVDKLKSRENLMKFVNNIKAKNPEAAAKIEKFLEDNKNTELRNLNKDQLKAALKDIVPAFKKTGTDAKP